jgi:hypothetical protein
VEQQNPHPSGKRSYGAVEKPVDGDDERRELFISEMGGPAVVNAPAPRCAIPSRSPKGSGRMVKMCRHAAGEA